MPSHAVGLWEHNRYVDQAYWDEIIRPIFAYGTSSGLSLSLTTLLRVVAPDSGLLLRGLRRARSIPNA